MRGLKVFVASAAVMLLLPFAAVKLAPADAGMAICLLLFYMVNPFFSVFIGISCGKDFRKMWYFPLVSSMLFVVGTMSFFEADEPLFLMYALCYLLLSYGAAAGYHIYKRTAKK